MPLPMNSATMMPLAVMCYSPIQNGQQNPEMSEPRGRGRSRGSAEASRPRQRHRLSSNQGQVVDQR